MLTDTSAGASAGTSVRRRQKVWNEWGFEALVIAVLAGALPLLLAAHYHSLGQPTDDDWSYLASLAHLAQHGTFNLNSWSSTFEIGQLVLACPLYLLFGVHPVLAVLWVWAMGLVGIGGTADLTRRCGVHRGPGLILIAALSLCPLFLVMDTTFMTDIPAYTVTVLALCAWIRSASPARFDGHRWLALGLVTVAFTIREPMACAAVPVIGQPFLAAYRNRDRRRCARSLAGAASWLILVVALYQWRQGLPSGTSSGAGLTLAAAIEPFVSGWLFAMFGLFLLPVVLVIGPRCNLVARARQRPQRSLLLIIATCALPVLALPWRGASVQLGNFVSVDNFLPVPWRVTLTLIGLASFAVMTLIAASAFDAKDQLSGQARGQVGGLLAIGICYAALLVAGSAVDRLVCDRYWFLVVALGGIVLCRIGALLTEVPKAPSTRRPRSLPMLALALLAFYALSVASDTAALHDGAQTFANAAVTQLPAGYGPLDVAVSMPWDGLRYATSPTTTIEQGAPGSFRLLSHDHAGSSVYSQEGDFGVCTPFAVESIAPSGPVPATAIAVSPISRGLFAVVRFALVRQRTSANCQTFFR